MTPAPASPRVGYVRALLQEIRAAARQLRRSPGLCTVIVAVLALGIGANATMFGIIDRLLLRPPSGVVDPEHVVSIGTTSTTLVFGDTTFRGSVPAFAELAESVQRQQFTLGRGEHSRLVDGLTVSASYFPLTGVRPVLGRFFLPEEDRERGGSRVVVLSYDFWQHHFGGDPNILGRRLDLSARDDLMNGNFPSYTVVGVAPRDFTGLRREPIDIFLPLAVVNQAWGTSLHARLRQGVTIQQAQAQVNAVIKVVRSRRMTPDSIESSVIVRSILNRADRWGEPGAQMPLLLAGVSVLVLAIACANVSNLLLGRALRRRREIAVRIALGISQRRLVAQLLAESLLLAFAGAAAALVVVALGQAAWFNGSPRDGSIADMRVLGFTAAVALITGLVSGLIPALQGSSLDAVSALKEGSRIGSVHHSRLRTALVLVQAALAVVLLVGTGLFVRSLRNLNAIDLGMQPGHVVSGKLKPPTVLVGVDTSNAAANATLIRNAEDRLKRLPGITSLSMSLDAPWDNAITSRVILPGSLVLQPPGRDSSSGFKPELAKGYVVSPGFFTTLGIPIRRGREFTEADRAGRAKVIVVSEDMAQRYWPTANPIGQCATLAGQPSCFEVVGVAAVTRKTDLDSSSMTFYTLPEAVSGTPPYSSVWFFVRTAVGDDPARWVTPVRRTLQAAAPDWGYADVRAMTALWEPQLAPRRIGATVFLIFGGLALVLAALGLYGVIAYAVTQRFHEIGVRIALGARVGTILTMIMSQGMKIAVAGVLAGLGIVFLTGRFVQPFLFHISPHDPLVIGLAVAVVCGTAALATYIPARRAARVDPTTALRQE